MRRDKNLIPTEARLVESYRLGASTAGRPSGSNIERETMTPKSYCGCGCGKPAGTGRGQHTNPNVSENWIENTPIVKPPATNTAAPTFTRRAQCVDCERLTAVDENQLCIRCGV